MTRESTSFISLRCFRWNNLIFNAIAVLFLSYYSQNTNAQDSYVTHRITDFILVNAETGSDIESIYDGMVIDLNSFGNQPQLTIRAEVQNFDLDVKYGVYFDFDSGSTERFVHESPFYLGGFNSVSDTLRKPNSVKTLLETGKHTLIATPIRLSEANGFRLQTQRRQNDVSSKMISFVVTGGNSNSKQVVANGLKFESSELRSYSSINTDNGFKSSSTGYVNGDLTVGKTLTIGYVGPTASETGMTVPGSGIRPPSTFADYKLDVTFVHLKTRTRVTVPGYFATDGNAAYSGATAGNVWLCHFRPKQRGKYKYKVTFKQGTNIAVNDFGNIGTSAGYFDGATGSFVVKDNSASEADMKSDVEPDVHGTFNVGLETPTFLVRNPLANNNTANASNSTSDSDDDNESTDILWIGGNEKETLRSLYQLVSHGIREVSIPTLHQNKSRISPFLDKDSSVPMNTFDILQYDVSKLAQWEILLGHAESFGMKLKIQLHNKLVDAYDLFNDGSRVGSSDSMIFEERKLYYREIIARFGHHDSISWDLGLISPADIVASTQQSLFIRSIDPYRHPILIQTTTTEQWNVLPMVLGAEAIDGVSIRGNSLDSLQTAPAAVRHWIDESQRMAQPWIVTFTYDCGDSGSIYDFVQSNLLWRLLFTGYSGSSFAVGASAYGALSTQSTFWDQSKHLLKFVNVISSMQTTSRCVGAIEREVPCLANNEETTFIMFAPKGTNFPLYYNFPVILDNELTVTWYKLSTGNTYEISSISEGLYQSIGMPPFDKDQDWAIIIK